MSQNKSGGAQRFLMEKSGQMRRGGVDMTGNQWYNKSKYLWQYEQNSADSARPISRTLQRGRKIGKRS
jgi:hypothetical protein